MSLPVLDLRDFARASTRDAFVEALRAAAHDIGFFYLVGHGAPDELASRVLRLSSEFFALPEDEKARIAMANSPHFRGYTRIGDERTAGRHDWREQLDVGLEAPALELAPGDPAWKRLQGPNQWPARPAALRPALLAWHEALQPIAARLLEAFALSLAQPAEAFADCWRGPAQPGRQDDPLSGPRRCTRRRARRPGLRRAQGQRVPDAAAAGRGRGARGAARRWVGVGATVTRQLRRQHRRVARARVERLLHRDDASRGRTARRSVEAVAGVLLRRASRCGRSLPEASPALRAAARGVSREPSNPLFREVAANTLKGRLRSHPDVAARFYADLVTPR